MRERFEDVFFVGEVIHGDYAQIADTSGMDSVTQYELWKAIWSSLETSNFYELTWTLKRHKAMLAHFVPWTFLGNHDTTRIASQLTDPARLPHAIALLLTLPGPGFVCGYEGPKV